MLFDATYSLRDLETEFHVFYEVSRILTKHCAHYEAEAYEKEIRKIGKLLTDENLESHMEKIVSIHNGALVMAFSFLSNTLGETHDAMLYDRIENHYIKSIAKSGSLIQQVITVIKQYQVKFFDDLFKHAHLDAIFEQTKERNHKFVNFFPLPQGEVNFIFEYLEDIRTLLQHINKLLKFTITYYLKKDD